MYFWRCLCTLFLPACHETGDALLEVFMYLVFIRMPGERYRWQPRSLLYLCNFFRALINSLVCWFWTGAEGLVLFETEACTRESIHTCHVTIPEDNTCHALRTLRSRWTKARHINEWKFEKEITYLHNGFNPRSDYCAQKVCSSPATFHTLKSISICQMSFTSQRKQHLDNDDCFYIALFSAVDQTHCIFKYPPK